MRRRGDAVGWHMPGAAQRQGAAASDVAISGELKQWHKVTLTLTGPQADESSTAPNPFTDYRMTVTFAHESGTPTYRVPGYFAGDGDAANSSATSGNKWRAHVAPDKAGRWTYRVSFVSGKAVALAAAPEGQRLATLDGRSGTFQVTASDKKSPDLRARGRLQYTGKHYLQFAGSGEYFLKLGADSPETLLAYTDFDGTVALKPQVPLHTFTPHIQDWRAGDPTWKGDKGKGLIGAVNYLASKGVNSISFLPYNAGGDGDNVWPFVARDDKFHYDVSKLDQWQIVFDHAQQKGVYLHFKLQENEIDDNFRSGEDSAHSESLDGGDTGPERKLYIRELTARFGYALGLNWNIGEENTQSSEQQLAMAMNLRDTDAYGGHHIVVHTFPNEQEKVYPALLGSRSPFTGASLQMMWNTVHERTLRWVLASSEAKKAWVVTNDEQGPAGLGVPPDPGYSGFAGKDAKGIDVGYTLHDIRTLHFVGQSDGGRRGGRVLLRLRASGQRSRGREFSQPRQELGVRAHCDRLFPCSEDSVLGDDECRRPRREREARQQPILLCESERGVPGGTCHLETPRRWTCRTRPVSSPWSGSIPRNGGAMKKGSVTTVKGGAPAPLGMPPDSPNEDWLAVVRRN